MANIFSMDKILYRKVIVGLQNEDDLPLREFMEDKIRDIFELSSDGLIGGAEFIEDIGVITKEGQRLIDTYGSKK